MGNKPTVILPSTPSEFTVEMLQERVDKYLDVKHVHELSATHRMMEEVKKEAAEQYPKIEQRASRGESQLLVTSMYDHRCDVLSAVHKLFNVYRGIPLVLETDETPFWQVEDSRQCAIIFDWSREVNQSK